MTEKKQEPAWKIATIAISIIMILLGTVWGITGVETRAKTDAACLDIQELKQFVAAQRESRPAWARGLKQTPDQIERLGGGRAPRGRVD